MFGYDWQFFFTHGPRRKKTWRPSDPAPLTGHRCDLAALSKGGVFYLGGSFPHNVRSSWWPGGTGSLAPPPPLVTSILKLWGPATLAFLLPGGPRHGRWAWLRHLRGFVGEKEWFVGIKFYPDQIGEIGMAKCNITINILVSIFLIDLHSYAYICISS